MGAELIRTGPTIAVSLFSRAKIIKKTRASLRTAWLRGCGALLRANDAFLFRVERVLPGVSDGLPHCVVAWLRSDYATTADSRLCSKFWNVQGFHRDLPL